MSKVVRVPKDCDVQVALELYYDWLPTLLAFEAMTREYPGAVRNEKLVRMFSEIGEISDRIRKAGE